jgi:hypothetical protein
LSGDSAANAVLNYASNLATHLPYIKVPYYLDEVKQRTAPMKEPDFRH